jgi:predicted enzyme related to lactoylglutathione lyase
MLMGDPNAGADNMELLVNIDVDDLPKAIAFYEHALDVRVSRRFGALGVELTGTNAPIYLLVKEAGTTPSIAADDRRRYGRHWTPVHLDFVVPNIEPAVARALAAGATQEGATETHKWGRIASLADPFGHGLCFIEFLGRGYDEIADP